MRDENRDIHGMDMGDIQEGHGIERVSIMTVITVTIMGMMNIDMSLKIARLKHLSKNQIHTFT